MRWTRVRGRGWGDMVRGQKGERASSRPSSVVPSPSSRSPRPDPFCRRSRFRLVLGDLPCSLSFSLPLDRPFNVSLCSLVRGRPDMYSFPSLARVVVSNDLNNHTTRPSKVTTPSFHPCTISRPGGELQADEAASLLCDRTWVAAGPSRGLGGTRAKGGQGCERHLDGGGAEGRVR